MKTSMFDLSMGIYTPMSYEQKVAKIAERAESVRTIPGDQLADMPEVREALLRRLSGGHEVYAYKRPFCDEFVIYDQQPESWMQCRFTLSEWRAWAIEQGYTPAPALDVADAEQEA